MAREPLPLLPIRDPNLRRCVNAAGRSHVLVRRNTGNETMMLKSRSYSNHLVLTSHTQAVEVSVKAYFPTPHGTPDRHFPKPSPSSRNSTLHGDGRPSPSKTSSWKSVLYFWKRPRDHTPSSKEEHKHQVPRVLLYEITHRSRHSNHLALDKMIILE
ncbi:hypothetical protein SELMODRAFT_415666 [Selaginella moellendorffii]|uniref:Uncharacterized protein n=1 Tax=Selaginella moellendorffii TaxID=88036 RepID=D8RWV1_SELML|nr:hypothetical protein SELMODRAFT_415666 [Selaginella moellendorffii]